MNGNVWVNGDATDNGFDDVFHPSRHEGLLRTAGQTLALAKDPFLFEQESESKEEEKKKINAVKDEEMEVKGEEMEVKDEETGAQLGSNEETQTAVVRSPVAVSVHRIWSSSLDVIKSRIASKGLGFWTMTTLFGLVGILHYMRKRDKRERELLMILLHEKDQRINQLLQQIALINEIKSIVKEVAVRKI